MIDKNTPIKEELRTAPQEVVNLWHNEYMRRWKIKNKSTLKGKLAMLIPPLVLEIRRKIIR